MTLQSEIVRDACMLILLNKLQLNTRYDWITVKVRVVILRLRRW